MSTFDRSLGQEGVKYGDRLEILRLRNPLSGGALLFALGLLFYPEYMLYATGVSGQPALFLLPVALLVIGCGLVYGCIPKDSIDRSLAVASFYSFLMTLMVHFVARAAIAPSPASQGAAIVPATPTLAGMSKRIFPVSSFTMILVTFPSCSNSLTLSTRFSEETANSSGKIGFAGAAGAGAGAGWVGA